MMSADDEDTRRRRTRIVVINDDTTFLRLMHDLLGHEEGYEVETRFEWKDAYESVRDLLPDAVILDLRVGGEDTGWQILELLRLDPVTRPIPVIVCSADQQQLSVREERLRAYDVRTLAKPFDLDDLLTLVREVLASRD
jgi:CheY-like chemotaxis protein